MTPLRNPSAQHSSLPAGERERLALAFLAALIGFLVTSNGFFVVARPALAAVLPAVLCAMIAARPAHAAVAAANAVAAGVLLSPLPQFGALAGPAGAFVTAAVCSALAAAGAAALNRVFATYGPPAVRVALIAILAFLIAAMWTGAVMIAGSDLSGAAPLATKLAEPFAAQAGMPDEVLFLYVIQEVRKGRDYYSATSEALSAAGSFAMTSPTEYRIPTLTWMLAALPPGGWPMIAAILAFGTAATLSSYVIGASLVKRPFALIGAAFAAQMYLRQAPGPYLTHSEAWAAASGLTALALLAMALRRGRLTLTSPLVWGRPP